jgi:RNA polymerase sigma-70 factor (ECF subfamily)
MDEQPEGLDTVGVVLRRLRGGPGGPAFGRASERLLKRAEPVARVVCHAEARGLSGPLVEELVQDTLEIVWRRMSTFDAEASFEAWVRGIARNVCANARRRQRDVLTDDGILEADAPELDALALLTREEREGILTGVVEATLDDEEQEILFHRYVHGLERERIAEVMGLSGGAERVRAALQRSQARLRTALRRTLAELGHGPSLFRTRDR